MLGSDATTESTRLCPGRADRNVMTGASDCPDPPADTHEELMEAGYRALVEHGYADLSMRKIAAESDRSHSLLQHYYGDKKGVVLELLSYLIDRYVDDVTDDMGGDPDTSLRRAFERALFGPADEDPERFWAFQTALFELRLLAREDEAVRERFRDGERRVLDRFAECVERGVADGTFRAVDPDRTALALRDLVDAGRFRRVTMSEPDAPERARWILETFVLPALRH
jgi:AcrR family transcriptional regulator